MTHPEGSCSVAEERAVQGDKAWPCTAAHTTQALLGDGDWLAPKPTRSRNAPSKRWAVVPLGGPNTVKRTDMLIRF